MTGTMRMTSRPTWTPTTTSCSSSGTTTSDWTCRPPTARCPSAAPTTTPSGGPGTWTRRTAPGRRRSAGPARRCFTRHGWMRPALCCRAPCSSARAPAMPPHACARRNTTTACCCARRPLAKSTSFCRGAACPRPSSARASTWIGCRINGCASRRRTPPASSTTSARYTTSRAPSRQAARSWTTCRARRTCSAPTSAAQARRPSTDASTFGASGWAG
mmetsp:Transcript_17674/g.45241  ORF Transcript_17674/g.45241 Transcript_17674/m.45241 type:complete len:217 (+) Transcript_17674:2103-2753(+)